MHPNRLLPPYLPALLWLTAAIAWVVLVNEGCLVVFDNGGLALFRSDQNPDRLIGPAMLTTATKGITHAGSGPFVLLLGASLVALTWRRAGRAGALKLGAVIAIYLLLIPLLKELIGRPRPDWPVSLVETASLSFPSGHAARAVLIYVLAALVLPMLTSASRALTLAVCAALALAVGVSRVALGVHWPSDVIGSWLLAGFWLSATWPLLRAELSPDPPRSGGS
ncbi:MAG: phosphatase PAP2 family protein [Xanthomonadales bacterium]|nr:phosphatase PAP2 family protein [Xanthomonadales bacterium]